MVARFLPSLTDIAFLMPLIFIFLKLNGARTLLGDGDTGWHVRTGEWILAHHQVPHADFFSFSRPGAPVVRLGMAVGCALRDASPALGTGRGRFGKPGRDLSYDHGLVPAGPAQVQ